MLQHQDLERPLAAFSTLSLAELDRVQLLDRTDTKYAFHEARLPEILKRLREDYRLLVINGRNIHRYHSVYLDTADHRLYISHHNGLRSRYKVRFRHYLDSGLQFLEVKKKDNKDRTRKQRLTMDAWQWPLPEAARTFLDTHFPYDQNALVPGMEITFSRLTLAHNVRSERLTLDLGLTFALGERTIVQPNLVVAELKQDRFSTQSPFAQMLRNQRIAPFSMSKYCMGMALHHPDLKQNNFKSRLLSLNKIANERAA